MSAELQARLDCPICRHRNWGASISIRGAALSVCRNCGLLATTAFLQEEVRAIEAIYEVTDVDRREYELDYLPRRLASYRRLLPRLERYRQSSRLLEVGCGYGHFLALAAERGWLAEGVEISAYACKIARQQGCNVHSGRLEQVDLPVESFDVIVMWDVIEHFEQPRPVIEHCRRLLRAGGALAVKTPDARALAAAKGPLQKLYQQLVYPANTPEHVYHYTPQALERLLTELGFGGFDVDAHDDWDERVISGRNPLVRSVRRAVMRRAFAAGWPYEFVMTAVKR